MAGCTDPRQLMTGADPLAAAVDEVAAANGFSGVVRVDRDGSTVLAAAYGLADRAHGVPVALDTQFGIASATKGFTALTIIRLVEHGALELATRARSLLGPDLPLIGDDVTVEHLLAHRSGIGDYFDEDIERPIDDYVLAVPVHRLATTEAYLAVLDGHPPKFPAGARFSYCNGGYVVLALLAERAMGVPFAALVHDNVCAPAGLRDTAFLRSDELPGRAARGYLDRAGLRTNVLHLPVVGSGDGGLYSTAADIHALWAAFDAGRIVGESWVAEMARDRDGEGYGLGFWLPDPGTVMLEGCDAGVSFRSVHDGARRVTTTVLSNTADGAWPVSRVLEGAARAS